LDFTKEAGPMNKRTLHIAEPCDADWDAMTGDDKERFCASCVKSVHHISKMTRSDATTLLQNARNEDASVCVRYQFDSLGEVLFSSVRVRPTAPRAQVLGARALVASALSVAAMLATSGLCASSAEAKQKEGSVEPAPPLSMGGLSPLYGDYFIGEPIDYDDLYHGADHDEDDQEDEDEPCDTDDEAAADDQPGPPLMGRMIPVDRGAVNPHPVQPKAAPKGSRSPSADAAASDDPLSHPRVIAPAPAWDIASVARMLAPYGLLVEEVEFDDDAEV